MNQSESDLNSLQAAAQAAAPDENAPPGEVYKALQRGIGRERVTDGNVDALIQLAVDHRDVQLEALLREWRSPCGDDADMPDLSTLPQVPPP